MYIVGWQIYYIKCPSCRTDHICPEGGFKNLPGDFKINNLLELRQKLTTKTANPIQTNTQTCPKHNDPLKVYCETCRKVICRDCTITAEHKTHTFHLISECYPKHYQQIQDHLNQLKNKLADINTAMAHLTTAENEVMEQGEHLKEQINTHAQQIIEWATEIMYTLNTTDRHYSTAKDTYFNGTETSSRKTTKSTQNM